jgi:hypothetical protein
MVAAGNGTQRTNFVNGTPAGRAQLQSRVTLPVPLPSAQTPLQRIYSNLMTPPVPPMPLPPVL